MQSISKVATILSLFRQLGERTIVYAYQRTHKHVLVARDLLADYIWGADEITCLAEYCGVHTVIQRERRLYRILLICSIICKANIMSILSFQLLDKIGDG